MTPLPHPDPPIGEAGPRDGLPGEPIQGMTAEARRPKAFAQEAA